MKRWLIYPFILILLAGLSLYSLLPYIAKNLIETWLSDQGFQNPTFTIERPGSHSFIITEIRVVKETDNRISTLQAGPVQISYDPFDLIQQQTLKRIEIPLASLEIAMKSTGVEPEHRASTEPFDLSMALPGQWFDYFPAEELVIGQLSLRWHGTEQPDYKLAGNIYLTRTELLSRIQTSVNDIPLTRNDLILTQDNRFKLALLNNNRPFIQLAGQLVDLDSSIEVDVLHSLYIDDFHWFLYLIPELDLPSLPATYGSFSGKSRISLPTQLHLENTEEILNKLTVTIQSRLTAQIEKPIGQARTSNVDLSSHFSLKENQFKWVVDNKSKVSLNRLASKPVSIRQISAKLTNPAVIQGNIFDLPESIEPFNLKLNLAARNIRQNKIRYPDINSSSLLNVNLSRINSQSRLSAPKLGLTVPLKTQTNLRTGNTHLQWSLPEQSVPSLISKTMPLTGQSLPKDLNLLSGHYQHEGTASWKNDRLTATIQHKVSNVELAYASTLIEGLNINSLTQIDDSSVKESGYLTSEKLTTALEATNLTAKYEINDLTSLPSAHLSQLSANLLGGHISISPFSTSFATPQIKTDIQLAELSLAELLKLQQQPELTGQGIINGQLPFELNPDGISIHNGIIKAEPGGKIAYRADSKVKAMAAANAGLSMALEALQNFHYQELSAKTEYQANGDLALKTELKGSNPDWNNGRQVNFAINIEQNLLKLLQTLQIADKLTDKLEKKYGKSN